MSSINVLLLCGGASAEHDVSLVSAQFLRQKLTELPHINLYFVEIKADEGWVNESGETCQLELNKQMRIGSNRVSLDYAIPCIHGFPGETGDIQSLFELSSLPYMGCDAIASSLCFNKISSKLWFDALDIPNTPFIFLTENSPESLAKVDAAFDNWGRIFIKAASQGSSIGCYQVTDKADIAQKIAEAFTYSNQVLIEKAVTPRELEIAAYEINGELIISHPGEIVCEKDSFYSFDEKYSSESKSTTTLEPENLSQEQIELLQSYARKAFVQMKLKDLSRIDFFLTQEGEILLNEINTFPGMTPISMFPKLMQHQGHHFIDYLVDRINTAVNP